MVEITLSDIERFYELVQKEHDENLREQGVELPSLKTKSGFNRLGLQLVYLRMHLRTLVSKEDIAAFVRRFQPDSSSDQQTRHLAYKGWDVRCSGKAKDKFDGRLVPSGFYVLASVEHPAKKFIMQRIKRLGRVAAQDWTALQEVYDHRCATCGKSATGKLEKGHKDPRLPMELANIIPMCGPCNNWAGDRFVFDDAGRVVALASPSLVLVSDSSVQYEIFLSLRERFK